MTSIQDRDAELARLLDEAACHRVIGRYSTAIDWADREALTSIFWPDAGFDFGAAFFIGSGAAGIDFLIASVNASLCRTHTLGATWLALANDVARAETPAVNIWLSPNPDNTITKFVLSSRYLWELHKRRNQWRVASLKVLISTAQCTPYELDAQPAGFQLLQGLGVNHALYPGAHT